VDGYPHLQPNHVSMTCLEDHYCQGAKLLHIGDPSFFFANWGTHLGPMWGKTGLPCRLTGFYPGQYRTSQLPEKTVVKFPLVSLSFLYTISSCIFRYLARVKKIREKYQPKIKGQQARIRREFLALVIRSGLKNMISLVSHV
jgi:hypothetical protein